MENINNSILAYLKENNSTLYDRIVRTLKWYRSIDFEDISQHDIMLVTPQKAFEYAGDEGDKYFKIWMVGAKIAWCTWANTMVDSRFRWNAKAHNENKRDNNDLLGNEPYVTDFLKSNSAIEQCSLVYMFPFEAFSKPKLEKPHKPKMYTENKANVEKKSAPSAPSAETDNLLDTLSDLSVKISGYLSQRKLDAFDKNRLVKSMTNFENSLMRMKYIDETNKMIPYYEKFLEKWNFQIEKNKSFIDRILDNL